MGMDKNLRFYISRATKTEIEVCIRRRRFSASRYLHALTLSKQRSATQHARSLNISEIVYDVLSTDFPCDWILTPGVFVEIALVCVDTPLPDISCHIVETVIVSRINPYSSGIPNVSVVICLACINCITPRIVSTCQSAACCAFLLRLRW